MPLEFSSNASFSADVAFTGYGFSIKDSVEWDDYKSIDVKDRWVAILMGSPDGDHPHSKYADHLPIRKKAMLAKDNDAKGVLFISKSDSDEFIPLRYDSNSKNMDIPIVQISRKFANDLLNDSKEISEHLMLLDLGRNDISRVSQPGTVKVTDKMYIEYFSHVMHIVSNIEAKLKDKNDSTDVLFSGFPAGAVTGAPKIRAIQIIEQLEKSRRNVYAGSVGYISNNGDVNTCIALRTALIKNNYIYVQAGAGIVADSKPKNEFKETENKALAILTACAYANNFK